MALTDVKRLMDVKRVRIRSDLPVRSFADFISLPREYWEDSALYFSVIYMWNGRGFSPLKPFCTCNGEMHPLHMHYLHLDILPY